MIAAVGPGGQFLTQRHTFRHLREAYWKPAVLDRHPRPQWEREGSRTLETALRERVAAILASHRPTPLAESCRSEIERIRRCGEQVLPKAC